MSPNPGLLLKGHKFNHSSLISKGSSNKKQVRKHFSLFFVLIFNTPTSEWEGLHVATRQR